MSCNACTCSTTLLSGGNEEERDMSVRIQGRFSAALSVYRTAPIVSTEVHVPSVVLLISARPFPHPKPSERRDFLFIFPPVMYERGR